ncbi:molybdenum cofactor guanylyltransferase [Rummeliibacillus pycnus]|uniref:molybdenum cofactor guanylyltransferase n=1 Tax=Rummeliibacillus pycnus TaxID=101070 RepID=UPI0037CB40C3
MTIAGVVLAGGQSSRYGKPKMFEMFNGQFLYQYSLQALKKNALKPLIISTNASLSPQFEEKDVRLNIEEMSHQGPLFALNNLLSKTPDVDWFFLLASDMPFITDSFVRKMLSFVDDTYDAIVPKQSDKIQPLAALYHRRALLKTEKLLQQNKRSMKSLLDQLTVYYVPVSDDEQALININAITDWPELPNTVYNKGDYHD